jgi:hypothetical protein
VCGKELGSRPEADETRSDSSPPVRSRGKTRSEARRTRRFRRLAVDEEHGEDYSDPSGTRRWEAVIRICRIEERRHDAQHRVC